jgi:hypothetical protein
VKAPVIDLSSSSNEEDLIAATSRDFEFAQKLFGKLNCAVLGPPDDDKIIVLSDSDEEEVHEEKTSGTKIVIASVVVNPASTASVDSDDAPTGVKDDNSDNQGAIRRLAVTTAAEMTSVSLMPSREEGTKTDVLQGELQWFCIVVPPLCVEKLG